MKNKKTQWYCIDCGHTTTNQKFMDSSFCPKCGGAHWIGKPVKRGDKNSKIMH